MAAVNGGGLTGTPPAAVSVSGLTVRFADRQAPALNDISLQIGAGERVAILGPSGCGKTTLLRALLGAVDATGEIRVAGLDPAASGDRLAIRRRCGVVRQGSDLVPQLSGGLNALLGVTDRLGPTDWAAILLGWIPRRWEPVLVQTAERHGVAACLPTRVSKLSGGERHRLALVRAVLGAPSLIIADEPTTGLDPRAVGRVVDHLHDTDDATLIITTHDLEVAARFPRKIGIRNGQILFDTDTLDAAQTALLYETAAA